MDVDALVKLISQVGFPIAVTGYLLVRYDRVLHELTNKIERLLLVLESRVKEG